MSSEAFIDQVTLRIIKIKSAPSWATNWDQAMTLFEEIREQNFMVQLIANDHSKEWSVQVEPRAGHDKSDTWWVSADSGPLAICLAWLKWKEKCS